MLLQLAWVQRRLENGSSQDVAQGVANALNAGIAVVLSAGNLSTDACSYLQNTVVHVIVVGATDRTNNLWPGSNFGQCVTIFAPGADVSSVAPGGSRAISSGASFAAALASGVVAGIVPDFLAWNRGGQAAWAAREHVAGSATANLLSGIGTGSPNLFLNSLFRYIDFQGSNAIVSSTTQTQTWSMNTCGGDGTWSNYIWERRVLPNGAYTVVGNGPTYSETIYQGDAFAFELRATATSFGASISDSLTVNVCQPSPNGCNVSPCPPQ